jgi:polyphosphate kinase 2 (PPK2 family)
VVVKFWLAIGKDVQFKRFKLREKVAFKRFKITDEDWRNRKKWPAYERAVNDMIERTSTEPAPWSVIASDDKLFARIQTLERLCDRVEDAL